MEFFFSSYDRNNIKNGESAVFKSIIYFELSVRKYILYL